MRYKRYSDEEMATIAKQLGVNGDKEGNIDANGVAQIWTWRIREEQEVEHTYTSTSVRKRVHGKSLAPLNPGASKLKFSIEDAFLAPLYPKKIVLKKS